MKEINLKKVTTYAKKLFVKTSSKVLYMILLMLPMAFFCLFGRVYTNSHSFRYCGLWRKEIEIYRVL